MTAAGVIVGLVVIPFIVCIVASEAVAWAPRWSAGIVGFAARRLPAPARDRYDEEWRAELAEVPGAVSRLSVALGIVFHSYGVARETRRALEHARAGADSELAPTLVPVTVNGQTLLMPPKTTARELRAAVAHEDGDVVSQYESGEQLVMLRDTDVIGSNRTFLIVTRCEVGPGSVAEH